MRASTSRARLLLAYMALVATIIGFARAAFPVHAQASSRATLTIGADDSNPTVNPARLPRSGLRRAALVLGPGLPDVANAAPRSNDGREAALERHLLVPESVAPAPPFHPPRRV